MSPDASDRNPNEPNTSDAQASSQKNSFNKDGGDAPMAGMDAPERPIKKMKRGKYISRACTLCHQRKVKCDGGEPCGQCIARKQPCVSTSRGIRQQVESSSQDGDASSITYSDVTTPRDSMVNKELLARFTEFERQFSRMQADVQSLMSTKSAEQPRPVEASQGNRPTPTSKELQGVLEADGQTFGGELSMSPDFKEVNTEEASNTTSPIELSTGLSIQPSGTAQTSGNGVRRIRGWLERVVQNYGLVADETQWRSYLDVFLDEIHPIYPFIHPPLLWAAFNELWEESELWHMTDPSGHEEKRLSVGLVFLCLALGRVATSTRMTDTSGVESSGWTFYSAGLSIMPDVMEMSNKVTKSLLTLHTILIRVLYLFRLDATQRCERLLSLAVSIAYSMGLHRQMTMDNMSLFQNQMHCRTWWCIYIIDRRIAIESGQPILILDSRTDTALPLDVTDEWMSRMALLNEPASALQDKIATAVEQQLPSTMSYLIAMVKFSRVVGKAWDVVYGIKGSKSDASAMIDYADIVLCQILSDVPKDLKYDPELSNDVQFSSRPAWQIRQSLLLFTCCTYLRLLIRRPFFPTQSSHNGLEDDKIESVADCAGLAASILRIHEGLEAGNLKYCFPLSHYLTSFTMVMIRLVSQEPGFKRRYSELVLSATRSLNVYCHKIWVSGKMLRLIVRLSQLARQTFGDEPATRENQRTNENDIQQLTPQSDCAGLGHVTPMNGDSDVSWLPNDVEQRTDRSGSFSYNERMVSVEHGKQVPRAARGVFSAPSAMMDSFMEGQTELPDWAMSNFNFESSLDGCDGFNSTLSAGEEPMMGLENSKFNADQEFSDFVLGALGLGRALDANNMMGSDSYSNSRY